MLRHALKAPLFAFQSRLKLNRVDVCVCSRAPDSDDSNRPHTERARRPSNRRSLRFLRPTISYVQSRSTVRIFTAVDAIQFRRIKIWQLDEQTGTWSVEDDWRGHNAPIAKLSWAHPEFGTIIASAGYDRTVKIWEQSSLAPPNEDTTSPTSRWIERAVLLEARGSVRSVEFAPRHFGFKLVIKSSMLYSRALTKSPGNNFFR